MDEFNGNNGPQQPPQPPVYPEQPQDPNSQQQPQAPNYQNYPQAPQQQAPQQMPYQQPGYGPPPPSPGKGMNIASMVLGIVSLVFSFCLYYLSIPMSIVGLVLGLVGTSKAKNAGQPKGMGTAGVVMNIITLGIGILAATILAAFFASFVPFAL